MGKEKNKKVIDFTNSTLWYIICSQNVNMVSFLAAASRPQVEQQQKATCGTAVPQQWQHPQMRNTRGGIRDLRRGRRHERIYRSRWRRGGGVGGGGGKAQALRLWNGVLNFTPNLLLSRGSSAQQKIDGVLILGNRSSFDASE